MNSIAYCQCGCGNPAPIAPQTDTKKGWIKGQPRPFCQGHACQKRSASRVVIVEGVKCMTIPLTRRKEAIVDLEDFERLSKHLWVAQKIKSKWYASHTGSSSMIYMHREIMAMDGYQTDHRNGDGLDNRRKNLRPSTPVQNMMNKAGAGGVSPYKGVSFFPRDRRWAARLRRKHIGYYATQEEAARAYDAEALKQFGEFALLNFQPISL